VAEHNLLGRAGETFAAQFLTMRGMDILHTNWRAGKREIDIVAIDGKNLVFCEVKTRSADRFGFPEESIGQAKQLHLYEAAREYLQQFPHQGPLRFDVVSVVLNHYSSKLYYCPDAFFPMG
jgi:putative endonuclease